MLINVNVLDQAMKGVDGKSPYIGENGHWWFYNDKTEEWEDSGISPTGSDAPISDVIINDDFTITFVFSNGSTLTTPSIKGADAANIVYCTNSDKTLVPEGLDDEGIYHPASTLRLSLIEENFPSGYPQVDDFLITRGGVLLKVTARDEGEGAVNLFCYATCVANMNGGLTGDEFSVDRLYAPVFASIVGLQFQEVEINGVTHLRLD